ncbi:12206_t:CDS:2, partial [Funneliformis mosseae]
NKLKLKINELKCLKSEAISKPVVGKNDEKNIIKSDNISLGSTNLSKYFVHRKNMDPIKKINSEITELPKMKLVLVILISMEGIEVMRPSLKVLPLLIVASTLMTPLS